MRLTTAHPQSSYNIPIFVDDKNNPVDYATGIRHIRHQAGLNTTDFGALIGVSGRTVEDYEQGRYIPSRAVLLLVGENFKK